MFAFTLLAFVGGILWGEIFLSLLKANGKGRHFVGMVVLGLGIFLPMGRMIPTVPLWAWFIGGIIAVFLRLLDTRRVQN